MALAFNDELVSAVRQGLCLTTSTAQRTAELGQNVWNSVGLRGVGQLSGQAAQLWGNAAGLACNRQPQDIGAAISPGFEGGQCPGDRYEVDITRNNGPVSTRSVTDGGDFIQGPISGISQFDNGTGLNNYRLNVGNGIVNLATNFTQPQNFQIVAIRNLTNPSDDCGSPSPVVDPYDPDNFTTSPPVTFTDENGIDVTINPSVTYAPITINANNEFSAPFEITFEDGSSLFGDFNLSTGDVNIGPGNSGGGGSAGPEREKDPDEPLEEGEEIVGVRVVSAFETLSGARLSEIATVGDAPNLYVPRLATVLFRRETAVGDGWSQPFNVQTIDAVIYSDVVSIDAAVTFRPGVTGSYKLVLRSVNSA